METNQTFDFIKSKCPEASDVEINKLIELYRINIDGTIFSINSPHYVGFNTDKVKISVSESAFEISKGNSILTLWKNRTYTHVAII